MKTGFVLLLLLGLMSCNHNVQPENSDDKILVTVYDEDLLASEIANIIPDAVTYEDSAHIANAYIEQWIRESLILEQAQKVAPPDLDKLVDDYKKSLLKLHFERQIIESNLDTIIQDEELQAYYDEHETDYLLKEKAIQLYMIKIPESAGMVTTVDPLWKEEKLDEIAQLFNTANDATFFANQMWYKISDLSNIAPRTVIRRIENNEGKRFSTSIDNFKYFVKVNEIKDKNEIPPLAVIESQLRKVILHKRKKKILENYTQDLYEKETAKKSIKIHS